MYDIDADSILLELAERVFPLVGQVAIQLGVETKNPLFATLGTLLIVVGLNVTTPPNLCQELYEDKIKTILDGLEQACRWPKTTTKGQYATLERIAAESIGGPVTGKTFAIVNPNLKRFFLKGKFDSVLKVLEEANTIKEITSKAMGLDISKMSKENGVPGYPQDVNNSLYETLTRHSSCGCASPHLKQAYLKLNEADQYNRDNIPFELLFSKFPPQNGDTTLKNGIWHQTMMFVSSKPKTSRKVNFVKLRQNEHNQGNHRQAQKTLDKGSELRPGEFCKHLKNNFDCRLYFRLTLENSEPIFRKEHPSEDPPSQDTYLAGSWSLAEYIRGSGAKIPVKERIYLAYVLAKSVWQYYGSDWMRNPWTHNDIRLLKRRDVGETRVEFMLPYHPYFTPTFENPDGRIREYCGDIDPSLTHRYPGVLALGTILLEIIQGQLLEEIEGDQTSDNSQPESIRIRKRFLLAWQAAAGLDSPDCNTIYREVIRKCLDGRLFKDAPFNPKTPNTLEIRQSILYREIVFPLKELVAFSNTSLNVNRAQPYDQPSPSAPVSSKYTPSTDQTYTHYEKTKPSVALSGEISFISSQAFGPSLNPVRPHCFSTSAKSILPHRAPTIVFPRPTSRSDFEIAIICALPLEYDAVSLLIDEYWDDDGDQYGRADGDQNTYTTGRIGRHNIVLALLPNIGKSNAARVATSFRTSYNRLQLALLVGICGGMPADKDGNEILLGDVVISASIFEYDLGRRFPNEFRPRNTTEGCNAKASPDIVGFINTLKTHLNSQRLHSRTSDHLVTLQIKSQSSKYDYPGISEDRLYRPDYRHKHHAYFNCSVCNRCIEKSHHVCQAALESWCTQLRCDESQLVVRRRAEAKEAASGEPTSELQKPLIHFGLIASGDTVMKSGEDRDAIALERNIIAFEMEGAGILDNLSCIVVKGVCDYADSHKNKIWQDFAAATAASVMKALLERYGVRDRQQYLR
ncbi:hypothetical protein TWF281_004368 [Arthrobotrys megalospora]